MLKLVRSLILPLFAVALWLAPAASAVSIEWVTVGDTGNAADTTGYGAVADEYRIGKYEVTNAQYADFLNAKAASDPLNLYNVLMPGITQSGSPGSHTYNTVPGSENKPVVYVSFIDALRFSNWLNNGQASGDTETGAYTLLGGTTNPTNLLTVTRNASANTFVTSENEWYKAAYYDALTASYNPDPFADGASGVCEATGGTTPHSANCLFAVGTTTPVGSYATSVSASGTFDQGGNADEWNESIFGSNRGLRGASWRDFPADLAATTQTSALSIGESDFIGFRVASIIPEPGTGLLLGSGIVGLGLGRRRRVTRRPGRSARTPARDCRSKPGFPVS